MRTNRRLALHVTARLLDDVDGITTIQDQREGTTTGSNVEYLRRRAHDQVDAFAFALASRVPPGPDLEYPDPYAKEEGYICVETGDAAMVAELLAGAARMLPDEQATLLHELEAQLRVQLAGRIS